MFIIKYRQRLSSIVIGAVILSFFLLAVIIVVSDNAIHIQANAKKEMIVSTPVSLTPSSLNDNSVLNDQNTTTATNNNNNSNGNTNSSSYLTYEDNADGISLMYPSNWQKIEYPSGAMNYGKGHRIIASFLAPLDPSDQWRGSLNIQISNLSDSKNIIPQNATTTMINLGGHPAFKLEYTNTERMYLNRDLTSSSSIKLKVMQVWTTIGDNTYLLTYNAEASKYPQYLPIIYKMLSSFRVS
ncbi:MAG: hypothetical protein ACJ71J_01820 [Nitrososphaeraceae archaeon]